MDNQTDKDLFTQKLHNSQAWTRFAARYIDIFLFTLAFGFVVGIVIAKFFPNIAIDNLDSFEDVAVLFFWVFFESICLSTWGTTPGKWLLNVSVRNLDGSQLNFSAAFKRSFSVFIFGLFCGLPVLSLLALFFSYVTLIKKGITKWDREGKFQLMYGKLNNVRIILIAIIFGLTLISIVFTAIDIFKTSS